MTLTPQMAEIAARIAKGMSNKQIAGDMGLSVETVETYIKRAAQRIDGNAPQRSKLNLWFFRADPEELDPTGSD